MNSIKLITATVFLFTCSLQAHAQKVSITAVHSEARDNTIAVHYTLVTE